MPNSQIASDLSWECNAASLRSRASSVVSTGTKFSISTLPQEESESIEAVFSGQSWRHHARPRSLRTLASHEQPAPPYEDNHMIHATNFSPYQHDVTIVGRRISPGDVDVPPASPAIDSENALSMHYGRVVRTIDENQAQEILRLTQAHENELAAAHQEILRLTQEHERNLAVTRHEVDQAYRKEFKAKNREVEKFREEANSRVASIETELQRLIAVHEETVSRMQQEASEHATVLKEAHEVAIDKARNEIEDIWEGRWSDRTRLAMEEARRVDLKSQRDLEKSVADRDEEWVRELASRHPELLEELQETISGLRAGK